MGTALEADLDLVIGYGDIGGNVNQIAKDLACLRIGITAHGFGENSIESTGDDQKDHVEIDFKPDGRRERIHMKEAHGIGDRVFDEHALGVSGNQFLGRKAELIGE